MPLRDLAIAALLFGGMPVAFVNPVYGVLLYAMFGYLNPHRLTWSFAQNLPVAFYTAVATMAGWVFYKGDRKLPVTRETVLMILLWLLASLGWVTALNPPGFAAEWDRFTKILLMIFLAMSLMKTRDHVRYLYWVVALSIGFYSLKGAVWGMRGGVGWVFGPEGSFFQGNNGLGLAINMVWPLFLMMARNERHPWVRLGLWVLFWVSPLTIVLTNSRASALALAVTAAVLFTRVRRKVLFGLIGVVALMAAVPFIPARWYDRMDTIDEYQEDASAMGRINAWHASWNMAWDYPLTGGGLNAFTPETIWRYAPNPEDYHDVHSIYFEVLGEIGFPGLFVFLGLIGSTMLSLIRIRRASALLPNGEFYANYADATLLGLVGYLTNGAFVGMAYFDLFYQFVGLTVSMKYLLGAELQAAHLEAAPRAGAGGYLEGPPSSPPWRVDREHNAWRP